MSHGNFSLHFSSWMVKIGVWNLQSHGCVCCHFAHVSLYQWHKQGWNVWLKHRILNEPTVTALHLQTKTKKQETNDTTWLSSEEIKTEAKKKKKKEEEEKKHFFCMNIDRTTKWSLQMEIFQHFLLFQANLRAWFSSPLKEGSFLMSGSIINSCPLKEGLSVMRGSNVVSSPLKEGLSLRKGSIVVSSPLKEGLSLRRGSTVNSVTWFSMCRNCIQRTWRVQWRPTSTVFWNLCGQSLSPQKWRRWSPKLTPLKKRVSIAFLQSNRNSDRNSDKICPVNKGVKLLGCY